MEAVFAIVGGLLMTSTALAQGPAIGELCEQKTAPESGPYGGAAPVKARYTLTNTGIYDLAVAPNPDSERTLREWSPPSTPVTRACPTRTSADAVAVTRGRHVDHRMKDLHAGEGGRAWFKQS